MQARLPPPPLTHIQTHWPTPMTANTAARTIASAAALPHRTCGPRSTRHGAVLHKGRVQGQQGVRLSGRPRGRAGAAAERCLRDQRGRGPPEPAVDAQLVPAGVGQEGVQALVRVCHLHGRQGNAGPSHADGQANTYTCTPHTHTPAQTQDCTQTHAPAQTHAAAQTHAPAQTHAAAQTHAPAQTNDCTQTHARTLT
jgi:hypothetical protein